MALCSFPGCGAVAKTKRCGLCAAHVLQRRTKGQMRPIARTRLSFDTRFWLRVSKGDYCWRWVGARNPAGYGVVRSDGRARLAHRVSYELAGGTIGSLSVCHTCDNPACVRPSHLFVGDHTDNAMDMMAKGRGRNMPAPLGEANWSARLTESDVIDIRTLRRLGARTIDLARAYDTARSYIQAIVRRSVWAHVP